MTDVSKKMAAGIKACRTAFGKCRKYEDDIAPIVHACSINTNSLKTKLKQLTSNLKNVNSALDKIKKLASRKVRTSRSTITCSVVVAASKLLFTYISQNPASTLISITANKITGASVTCTTTEKASLNSVATQITTVVVVISAEIESVQSTIFGKYSL